MERGVEEEGGSSRRVVRLMKALRDSIVVPPIPTCLRGRSSPVSVSCFDYERRVEQGADRRPVYAGDVARAVEIACRDDPAVVEAIGGKIIEAGGPDGTSLTLIHHEYQQWLPSRVMGPVCSLDRLHLPRATSDPEAPTSDSSVHIPRDNAARPRSYEPQADDNQHSLLARNDPSLFPREAARVNPDSYHRSDPSTP